MTFWPKNLNNSIDRIKNFFKILYSGQEQRIRKITGPFSKKNMALSLNLKIPGALVECSEDVKQIVPVHKFESLVKPLFDRLYLEHANSLQLTEKQVFDMEIDLLYTLKHLYLSIPEEDKDDFVLRFKQKFSVDEYIQTRIDLLFCFLNDQKLVSSVTKFFINILDDKKREGLQFLLGAELLRIYKEQTRTRAYYYYYDNIPDVFNVPFHFCFLVFENDVTGHNDDIHTCFNGFNNPYGSLKLSEVVDVSDLRFDKNYYIERTGNLEEIELMHNDMIVTFEKNETNSDSFSLFSFNPQLCRIPFSGGFAHTEMLTCEIYTRVFFNHNYQLQKCVYMYGISSYKFKHPNQEHNLKYFKESVTFLKKCLVSKVVNNFLF